MKSARSYLRNIQTVSDRLVYLTKRFAGGDTSAMPEMIEITDDLLRSSTPPVAKQEILNFRKKILSDDNLEQAAFFLQRRLKSILQRQASVNKIANLHVSASRLASLYLAKEFGSKKELQKYLKEHPKADPKNHTVSDSGEKKKNLGKLFEKANQKMREALNKASANTKKFFTDPAYRKEAGKEIAAGVRDKGKKILTNLWSNFKNETSSQKRAMKDIALAVMKKKKLSKDDMKNIYGAAVYWAGAALGAATAGASGALFGGAKALLHSMGTHSAIKALASEARDWDFLNVETAETVGSVTGLTDKLPFNTGDIPGVGHVMEFAKSLIASEEDEFPQEEKTAVEKFLTGFLEKVAKQYEEGLSEEDINAILQYG